jgi:hypothetical protein
MKGELVLKNWDDAVEQWLLRVSCLAAWCPELELPIITAEDRQHMIAQICHGAVSYKDIKERAVMAGGEGLAEPAQCALVDKYAPERITLPNGRTSKVTYAGETPPYFGATIQNLYGREGITAHRPRPGPADRASPGPQPAAGAGDPGSGRLLARPLSAREAGAAAEISATRVAVK